VFLNSLKQNKLLQVIETIGKNYDNDNKNNKKNTDHKKRKIPFQVVCDKIIY